MKTLFLTLRVFSATGGIEKVSRILGKALYENTLAKGGTVQVCSMYDRRKDADNNRYFPSEIFRGYEIKKIKFLRAMVTLGRKHDLVILSHVNLLLIGWLVKKFSPATRVILLAHGVEVWTPFSPGKKKMLQRCDKILAVSNFTRDKMIASQQLAPEKCEVLHNCLDPFLPLPVSSKEKNKALLKRYRLADNDFIVFTLTRISSEDKYKGYNNVIEAIALLVKKYPSIRYLLAGKYDDQEKNTIDSVVATNNLQRNVIIPGFIAANELREHYALADVFVMPSTGEGFGIAFIEAMYYNVPVIAGCMDGSRDALLDGKLGQLIDPAEAREIAQAIETVITNTLDQEPNTQLLMSSFSYETYQLRLGRFTAGTGMEKNQLAA